MTRYGSYELSYPEIGRGGMGIVYKAQHSVLGTAACVKHLLPEWTKNEEIVHRFINEARAAARLSHRNIVDVKDCNQAPDGTWFIVLEFLDGMPLSKWIRSTETTAQARVAGRIDVASAPGAALAQVVRILVQVANALHTAHDAGIVHRDVKPDNVFIVVRASNDLHVVLLDFGIAKLRDSRGGELTRTGVGMGTPAYMAPEQLADAKVVDRRADVYALGVMLYEMLTGGWLPWHDEQGNLPGSAEIYRRQTSELPPDPRHRNPTVPSAMAEVVRRALAPDPRERWASACEFARAIAEAHQPDGVSPAGAEILRRYAEELWDPADPMLGRRLTTPVTGVRDDSLWRPPLSAVSITTGHGTPPLGASRPAGRSLRAPPDAVPATTLGGSASQSVPVAMPVRRRRWPLIALAIAGAVVGLVVLAVALGRNSTSADAVRVPAGTGSASAVIDAQPAKTSVAVLTEPVGAAIFIDDELVGTSPTKVLIVTGATVRVRAELAGHAATEESHAVGNAPQTVRLALAPHADAAPPVDAGTVGAAPSTGPKPTGQAKAKGSTRQSPSAGSGSGGRPPSGSGTGFDPENIGGD